MAEPITWLRFEESFFDPHPKVYRLAALLDIDVANATVEVAKLWFFVARYDRSEYRGRITEHVAQLESQVLHLVTVDDLLLAGLVDRNGDGQLFIHDWYETNGKHLAKYQRERERKRKARVKAAKDSADLPRTGGGSAAEGPTRPDEDRTGTKPDLDVDGGGRKPPAPVENGAQPVEKTADPVENLPDPPTTDTRPAIRGGPK